MSELSDYQGSWVSTRPATGWKESIKHSKLLLSCETINFALYVQASCITVNATRRTGDVFGSVRFACTEMNWRVWNRQKSWGKEERKDCAAGSRSSMIFEILVLLAKKEFIAPASFIVPGKDSRSSSVDILCGFSFDCSLFREPVAQVDLPREESNLTRRLRIAWVVIKQKCR